MYPIIELGPLNLGSGALLLVIAVFIGHTQFERIAHKRGGDELEQRARRCAPFALLGAAVGARLWYGFVQLGYVQSITRSISGASSG